jgi:LemA protein
MGMWITIGIIAVLVIAAIAIYNNLVRCRKEVDNGWAQIDVQLKRRCDLIPNLVESVKAYASHEKDTIQAVVAARSQVQSAGTDAERLQAEGELTGTLRSLFAVAEAYPDLKANTSFLDLQSQLKTVEEDIANSRKYYNGCVKAFNNKCQTFPSSIIAGMFHFEPRTMFEVSSEEERENVKVEF